MTHWPAKGMGIMFGGVTDEDTDEETLISVFHRDLYVLSNSVNPVSKVLILSRTGMVIRSREKDVGLASR
jgi:hypothetical protein